MVVFNIGNKQVKYTYPETASDITMEQYIYFVKHLLPKHPAVEREAIDHLGEREQVFEKIKPYAKKLKIDTKGKQQFDVIELLSYILDNDEFKALRDHITEHNKKEDEELQALSKWKWMVAGGVVVMAWIVSNIRLDYLVKLFN